MSAVNPNQLRMFMTADEIVDHYKLGDTRLPGNPKGYKPDTSPQSVLDRKYQDTQRTGFSEILRNQGVRDPVHVSYGTTANPTATFRGEPALRQGHHRVAWMQRNHPDQYLPVVHHDDAADAVVGMWVPKRTSSLA